MPSTHWTLRALWFLCTAALLASAVKPYDRLTWALEICWVVAGLVLIPLLWRRFPLTPLLCWLLFIHALILIIGGQYTYSRVPAGDWLRDLLDLKRNHYDRLGHFAQGFVPAILVREYLLRRSPLRPGWLLFVLVTACCLAFSAWFELLEFAIALRMGGDADEYLATQGDKWDTQWDMLYALVGAILAQLTLARWHDRQLAELEERASERPQSQTAEKVRL